MPFTLFHMGPGIAVKSLLQGSFSLMIFGWTQIVMDVQPLVVILTGQGHMHGFSHTYLGATIIAVISAVSGKYMIECGVKPTVIYRKIAFLSAFIGSFSHVLLDSIMHRDCVPLYPFSSENHIQGIVSVSTLHSLCVYSGWLGIVCYYSIVWFRKCRR